MKTLQEQSEIVKMRLEYHFGTGIANQWNIPKDMPFMKEFLNEVEQLCALSHVVGRSEQLPCDKCENGLIWSKDRLKAKTCDCDR